MNYRCRRSTAAEEIQPTDQIVRFDRRENQIRLWCYSRGALPTVELLKVVYVEVYALRSAHC
jgi:hypothetical protein